MRRDHASVAVRIPGLAGFAAVVATCALLGAVAPGAGCTPAPAATPERGRYLFENYCVQCHADNAGGKASIAAPSIAGLPEWYVESELHQFRAGVRGSHFDDLEGMRMRPMALTLGGDVDVKAVSMYVASLPPAPPPPSPDLHGDATRGKQLFATCTACHGPEAKGDDKQQAPPLTVQPDWYLEKQLHKFKAGVRGANPKDEPGTRMRPMAQTLPDDQAVKDVVAYVMSLRGGASAAPAGH